MTVGVEQVVQITAKQNTVW